MNILCKIDYLASFFFPEFETFIFSSLAPLKNPLTIISVHFRLFLVMLYRISVNLNSRIKRAASLPLKPILDKVIGKKSLEEREEDLCYQKPIVLPICTFLIAKFGKYDLFYK